MYNKAPIIAHNAVVYLGNSKAIAPTSFFVVKSQKTRWKKMKDKEKEVVLCYAAVRNAILCLREKEDQGKENHQGEKKTGGSYRLFSMDTAVEKVLVKKIPISTLLYK